MKTLSIIVAMTALFLSGFTYGFIRVKRANRKMPPSIETTKSVSSAVNKIRRVEFNQHNYLVYGQSIIHEEGCTNKAHR